MVEFRFSISIFHHVANNHKSDQWLPTTGFYLILLPKEATHKLSKVQEALTELELTSE